MQNLDTMTFSHMQAEIFDNNELCEALGGWDAASAMDEPTMRENIREWIIAGDECA